MPALADQAALLAELRTLLMPIIAAERLTADFTLKPGSRLTRAYGRCAWSGETAVISIRCTADGDRTQWRRRGAIVGTLLHELAHLRYRSHGPRFWALHRRLVDRAASDGIYDPADRDPSERGRGDEKLAGSAAGIVAHEARLARRSRARVDRAAVLEWRPGEHALVNVTRGRLAGAVVTVVERRRTRLVVEVGGPSPPPSPRGRGGIAQPPRGRGGIPQPPRGRGGIGRRYLVSPSLLVSLDPPPSSIDTTRTRAAALMPAPSQK